MTDNQPKSPFPGMDPYMESRWADIHARLIVYASNQLNSQLPGDLSARIEETLTVEEDDNESRLRHIEIIDLAGRVITALCNCNR